jgi:A/G-specific adenine glycosylase
MRASNPMAKRKQASPLPALFAGVGIARFRRALLAWYEENRRDLPWRRTRDPYAIWVSEIMLQQTRVAAVLDHYRVFGERFPDIATLAGASEDDVLATWSGLGYYRRARMLHQCAREIVEQHSGRFPESAEGLRKLPGIGRYTAAAIASIAFAEPVAVVDGNVERVLERYDGRTLTTKETWERAQELLAESRPGEFNQAMMELGATVCLPREPRCLVCPVRQWCATQGEVKRAKSPSRQKRREIWCALKRRNGQVRLVRRPPGASVMAGMWELPQWPKPPHAVDTAVHWRTFRHSITVTDYTVHVFRYSGPNGAAPLARGKWIAIEKIPRLPITGLARKILKADGVI